MDIEIITISRQYALTALFIEINFEGDWKQKQHAFSHLTFDKISHIPNENILMHAVGW